VTAAAELRRIMPALEKAKARAAVLERRLHAASLRYSDENGYRIPLRPEQIKRELGLVQ
jgi:hypothetical protein